MFTGNVTRVTPVETVVHGFGRELGTLARINTGISNHLTTMYTILSLVITIKKS